jgi:hypothetical protein
MSSKIIIDDKKREKASKQITKLKREINFDTLDYPIEVLVHKFKKDELFIPSYQRKFIWTDKQKCRLIESLLLGLPVPFMFFSDNDDGNFEIIDGAQRTSTLEEFVNGDLRLKDLEKLTELNGFTFEELPERIQRKFKNIALRVIVLSENTTIETRQDIFNRINTGGTRAIPVEIRRGSHPGKFTDFIIKLTKNELFIKNCPITEKVKKRFEDEELITRFFAFYFDYKSFSHSVDEFLEKFVSENKDNFDKKEYQKIFQNMLEFVDKHFPFGFRKIESARSTPRVRFEAISVGVALALKEKPDLIPSSMNWLDSEDFKKHTTTHSSNSPTRVRGRIEYVKNQILGKSVND